MTIDPIALKTDISNILSSLLGTYTFPDGTVQPAIAVLPDPARGWLYPDEGTITSGLEVIIKQPYPSATPNISGDILKSYGWEIHFNQWNTQASLLGIVDLVISNISNTYFIDSFIAMPPSSTRLLAVEQAKIFIKEWAVSTRC